MEETYLNAPGKAIAPEDLVVARAKTLCAAILEGRLDFVRLIECRRCAGQTADAADDILVVDVEVERPQLVVNDIRRVERIAVVLASEDASYPEVLSLRSDFPVVPHLNLRTTDELPQSLCLYDRSWDEVRTRWTAPSFIERIRGWLADTAVGALHREDQPLEQVLAGTGYRLVLPWSAIKTGSEPATRLEMVLIRHGEREGTFVAHPLDADEQPKKREFIASLFIAGTRQHGVIRRSPRTLEELCNFLRSEGFDLLAELRARVKTWKEEGFLGTSLIIVVVFPLQRDGDSSVEVTDTWAFLTADSVYEVGRKIGIWEKTGNTVGAFISPIEALQGADVRLDIMQPHFGFSRESAAHASGVGPERTRCVAVGAGSIGSQIVLNLVREGFGRWTIIDDDVFMPHNLARHALPSPFVGWPKADAVAALVNGFYTEEGECVAVRANALRPGEQAEKLGATYSEAELILDFSASVPVARHLAHEVESGGKRMSLFMNPRGSDLVLLSEDRSRSLSLDALEAQYHRAVIRAPELKGHLAANESRTRYARTCRDVSFSIPTHLVSLHAAIAARAVRAAHAAEQAVIRIWQADPTTCAVSMVDIPVAPSYRAAFGEWAVVLDRWLLDHLQQLRRDRLPNETGGVLLGMFDLPRKTVYVVDTIGSPTDSQEKPLLYIRGCEGLAERVAAIRTESAEELEYIGEWHSHPDGCGCGPSTDDLNLFANITDRMTAAGFPGLMAIVGQHNQSAWFLGTMASDSGWTAP